VNPFVKPDIKIQRAGAKKTDEGIDLLPAADLERSKDQKTGAIIFTIE
jgi:hypothetical protein